MTKENKDNKKKIESRPTPTPQDKKKTKLQENETSSKKGLPSVPLPSFCAVKAGMARIFDSEGNHIPVTVLKLIPNYISQVKTKAKDHYEAYQIAFGEKREKLLNRPLKGHLRAGNVKKNLTCFFEVRVDKADPAHLGSEVSLKNFSESSFVDATGISKGKGLQGVIKRWNFSQGPRSHGSRFHRTGGAVGNRTAPGRIWKNKKMPGHMGDERKTVQNLQIVGMNTVGGYLLLKGPVPGSKNGLIRISQAVKKSAQILRKSS